MQTGVKSHYLNVLLPKEKELISDVTTYGKCFHSNASRVFMAFIM